MAKPFRGVINVDVTAEDEMNMASRKAQWPVGRGFERFYGFLGAETNQWYPDLVYDNHPDREVERGRIRTQPGKFSIAGEGLNVGKDAGEPVTDDYPGQGPWAFTGGTIKRAAVDVSGAPFVDLAAEARMAFMRD
jgi:hypothetical protein